MFKKNGEGKNMTEPVAKTLIDAFVAEEPAQFQGAARAHLEAKWAKNGVPEGERQTAGHMAAKAELTP